MPSAANSKVQKNFDYASLDADTSHFVQQQTGEIKVLMKQTVQGILAIGLKLLEVKHKLKHGKFGDWLAAEFEWSQDTASNFMRVAERFGNNPKISEFAPSALYLLAARSTPELARVEAIARASAGEQITHKTAKALKQKYGSTSKKTDSTPKIELERLPSSSPASESEIPPQAGRSKPEIVAIVSRTQEQTITNPNAMATRSRAMPSGLQPKLQSSQTDAANTWWSLDGKHLLFCGDPNSHDFVQRVSDPIALLLSFPAITPWHFSITYDVSNIVRESILSQILKNKDSQYFEDLLEGWLLNSYQRSKQITICFLPAIYSSDRKLFSSIILGISNNKLLRAVVAEPDSDRCQSAIADWKRAGGKVQRLDSTAI